METPCLVCGYTEPPHGPCGMQATVRVSDARVQSVFTAAFSLAPEIGNEVGLCNQHGILWELAAIREYRCASLYVEAAFDRVRVLQHGQLVLRNVARGRVDIMTWPGGRLAHGNLGHEYMLFGRIRVRNVTCHIAGVHLRGVWSCENGDLVNLREV